MIELIATLIFMTASALLGAIVGGERVFTYNLCEYNKPVIVDLAPVDRNHHDYKVITCHDLTFKRGE